MTPHSTILSLAALAVSSVLAAPTSPSTANNVPAAALQARAVIAHDAVVGFAETVPATTEGDLMLKFKPYLKVFNGCVPFPAVDSDGNTSYVCQENVFNPKGVVSLCETFVLTATFYKVAV